MPQKKNERSKLNFTKLLYQDFAWGPLYKKKDGKRIKGIDNNSKKYIDDSLKTMKLSPRQLRGKKVFNIGTGREAKVFANYGASVVHLDLGKKTVDELKIWVKKNKKDIQTFSADINNFDLGIEKFDIIFLSGIYQHLENPAKCLIKFINSLKKNGLMYLGFYRSGEFKYFIVDAIRHLISKKLFYKVRNINSITHCFGQKNHFQSSRVMDDFFVPYKHNFHPKDIIKDIKTLGASVLHSDKDLRDYNHESPNYFTIGFDRIYIKKRNNKISKPSILKQLKTQKGKNQLLDINYKEKIIKENIKLIKLIKKRNNQNLINSYYLICLAISMYQFTRPYNLKKSYYYDEVIKNGRHKTLNLLLRNFLKNITE